LKTFIYSLDITERERIRTCFT